MQHCVVVRYVSASGGTMKTAELSPWKLCLSLEYTTVIRGIAKLIIWIVGDSGELMKAHYNML